MKETELTLPELGQSDVEELIKIALDSYRGNKQRISALQSIGMVGDVQAVEPLIRLARSKELKKEDELPQEIIDALCKVLERSATSLPRDLLEDLRGLGGVKRIRYTSIFGDFEYVPIDCSRIRNLAKQELAKRKADKKGHITPRYRRGST